MAFKFRVRTNRSQINLQSFPDFASDVEAENLTGMVDGMTASAPEERMANALRKAGVQFLFRQTVGAPRGLPGWKEVDFIVYANGMLYPIEVDTVFTHRNKGQSDILHDAIILNDPYLNSAGQVYPQVTHAHGETELADQKEADAFVKKMFPQPTPAGSPISGTIERGYSTSISASSQKKTSKKERNAQNQREKAAKQARKRK